MTTTLTIMKADSVQKEMEERNLRPRLCYLTKGERGYGFHLHGEHSSGAQFIRRIEAGSPAELAGLRSGDRVVEVNGENVEKDSHQQVVQKIMEVENRTRLLVVDRETDKFLHLHSLPCTEDLAVEMSCLLSPRTSSSSLASSTLSFSSSSRNSVTLSPPESIVLSPRDFITHSFSDSITPSRMPSSITSSPPDSMIPSPQNSTPTSPHKSVTTSPEKDTNQSPSNSRNQSLRDSVNSSPCNSVTQAPYDLITELSSNTITKSASDSMTQSPSDSITQSPSNSTTHSPSNSITQLPSNSTTHSPPNSPNSITQSVYDSITQSPYNPVSQSPYDSVVQSPSDLITLSPYDSVTHSPSKSITTPFSMEKSAKTTEMDIVNGTNNKETLRTEDKVMHDLRPRLCHIVKNKQGFGFNLHRDKRRVGHFIRSVDSDSPAQHAGLRPGDRVVQVNGRSIEGLRHVEVVEIIRGGGGETKLLVVDSETDALFEKLGITPTTVHLNEDCVDGPITVSPTPPCPVTDSAVCPSKISNSSPIQPPITNPTAPDPPTRNGSLKQLSHESTALCKSAMTSEIRVGNSDSDTGTKAVNSEQHKSNNTGAKQATDRDALTAGSLHLSPTAAEARQKVRLKKANKRAPPMAWNKKYEIFSNF